jgi:hypothetical protein
MDLKWDMRLGWVRFNAVGCASAERRTRQMYKAISGWHDIGLTPYYRHIYPYNDDSQSLLNGHYWRHWTRWIAHNSQPHRTCFLNIHANIMYYASPMPAPQDTSGFLCSSCFCHASRTLIIFHTRTHSLLYGPELSLRSHQLLSKSKAIP